MIYVCDSCNRNVRLTRTRDPHPRRAICPHCEHVGTLRRRTPCQAQQVQQLAGYAGAQPIQQHVVSSTH